MRAVQFDCHPELERALKYNLAGQAVAWVLGAMMLDGGTTFQGIAFSSAVYWVFNVFTLIRRRATPTQIDLILAKAGFLFGIPVGWLTMPLWGWLRN